MQLLNMEFIFKTFGALILLRFTDFNEIHPSKNDSISLTNEKSKLVKSIIVIF